MTYKVKYNGDTEWKVISEQQLFNDIIAVKKFVTPCLMKLHEDSFLVMEQGVYAINE